MFEKRKNMRKYGEIFGYYKKKSYLCTAFKKYIAEWSSW